MQTLRRYDPPAKLKPGEPGSFDGYHKKSPAGIPHLRPEETDECPVCRGHGGWNLRLDAYGAGQHFQASCFQCGGYGHVEHGSKDAVCIHEWRELSQAECRDRGITHFGSCYHVDCCTKCGRTKGRDSSG